jgi:hypothetical protein
MRARSWMAALALIAGTSIVVGRAMPALVPSAAADQDQIQAPDEKKAATSNRSESDESKKDKAPDPGQNAIKAKTRSRPAETKPRASSGRSVEVDLVIAGLGRDGCDVDVKPANASCKFRAFDGRGKEGRQHVSSDGRAKIELRDVELRGADRTCTVAITVSEKDRPAKTYYRGFRLAPVAETANASKEAAPIGLYLRSPPKVARSDDAQSRK